MAVTKIKAIKSTPDKAIAYIEDPDKTEYGQLVSAYNCSPDTVWLDFAVTAESAARRCKGNSGRSSNLAYHLIQSFSPNDPVTPEQAHEIGRQLADRFLNGEYEYVISTHVDRNHIHNHIIINATSWLTGRKLRTRPFKTAQEIRAISDQLCISNELSVISKPGKLPMSYTEWSQRRRGTSWKAELRKRLNFILARAVSYDSFLSMCRDLDVAVDDTGKHIKYQLRDLPQQKWARGNKLADTDHFTLSGIQEQVKENARIRKTLWTGITEEIAQSGGWDDFLQRLESNHGIRITTGKTGLIFHTQDGERRKESELGTAFQREQLERALQDRSYFPGDEPTAPIREQWDEYIKGRNRGDVRYIPVELKAENIAKISLDGLLLRLPYEDGERSFFLDSSHVDYEPETQTYTAYLASGYEYYAAVEHLNPDLPESEQLTSKKLRGEDIIRSIERENAVEGHWTQVPAEYVRSIRADRLLVTVPGEENKAVRFSPEDVRLDTNTCFVRIYDRWTYGKNLLGTELRLLLNDQPKTVMDSLWRRYRAYERRSDHQRTATLANTLRYMEREGIDNLSDFALRRQALTGEQSAVQSQIRLLQQKVEQYAMAHRELLSVEQFGQIHHQVQSARGFIRGRMEKKYANELKAYDQAVQRLTAMKVHTTVDPEKVEGLMGRMNEQIRQFQRDAEKLDQRMEELDEMEKVVRDVTAARQEDERDDQRTVRSGTQKGR